MTPDEIDLEAYRTRIAFAGAMSATRAVFEALHLAHVTHIAFENLDILLSRPIRIDLASIQAKLVAAKRGGYCYEQNRLFAAVLEKIGFRVEFLAARVRYHSDRVLPRTHALLKVEVDGKPWIADVGFGTVGLLQPIPLVPDAAYSQFGWNYRLIRENELWILQTPQGNEWQSLYAFTLEPQYLVDLEMSNHYVSTHPDSRFTQMIVAQRSAIDRRFLLRNFDLIEVRAGESTTTTLRDEDELLQVLAEKFDLHFPAGTHFRTKVR